MDYIKITLKPGKEDSFHRFHPWVFSGAIYRFEKQPEEGDIVEVTDHQGNFIGIGPVSYTHLTLPTTERV